MDFSKLKDSPRLLIEAQLTPIQGSRFQPTGFPDLGAATYQSADGEQLLLVESAQSMANRLESVCWDEAAQELVPELKGIPYVQAHITDGVQTNSILEAHRLNSPYIVKSPEFEEQIKPAIGFEKDQPFDRLALARALAQFDLNSLLHGVFLEKVGGTVRLPRAMSAFVEARQVRPAPYGGVKLDRVQPSTSGDHTQYGKAAEGYGNVPYHRTDYTGEITAFFNVDLAQIRAYGLGESVEKLLIALSVYKIQKLLHSGLRLRTACDLDVLETVVKRPAEFALPPLSVIREILPELIAAASEHFASPSTTVVNYSK